MTKIIPRLDFVEKALEISRLEKCKLNIIIYRDSEPQNNSKQIKEAKKTLKKIKVAEINLKRHHDEMWNKFVETDIIEHEDMDELKRLMDNLISIKHKE